MAGVTKDTQAQTARLAVPGEVVGANEALTTDVQLPLSPDQTPDQHVAVAHALATDPRLVDRNGNPMFADGTLFYTPDGEPQYHVNSLSNQQISGIDANDYVTDLASIIPAAKSVLEDHGVKPTIAVNQSIRSAPSIAEASPSTTIDLPNGEDNGAQSSNSDTNRPESYSETSGAPAPPGNALGSSHDLRGSFDKATADSVNTAVIKATSDPQGFVDQNGPSVSSPDNPPPDADMDATEEAPANAGASSVSNAEPGSSGATEDAPASQVEALKKAYGTDPDTLLAGIKKRKAANRTHADINDSDGSKLNDDIATYGAFKIAELNDSQKANFRSWQKSITDSLDSEDTKKIKKLWDASQDKHQRALAQTDPDMGAISSARSSLKGAKAQRPGRVPKAEKPPKVRAVDTGPSSVAATGAKMPVNPKVYSTAFEMQLKRIDFGRGRQVHFNRANEALHNAIMADPEFAAMMEKLSPGVTERVSKSGGRRDPVGFTWEHASSTTASGRVGVMRLVPREQHTPGSLWWRVLHPDVGARGGYYEWARPNGAPKNKVRRRK
ncbi:hypothetical protein CCAX7_53810 [Capsulimonas corticalis]|uniref:Uncharacterized protein n=2 Tax=Capsulimonas corticalis TaxID=2219043 RepID=A0A402CNJ7_9BACT|nr:hypothetical protein CCAX7_53810 [Capsulimonas corticalis]